MFCFEEKNEIVSNRKLEKLLAGVCFKDSESYFNRCSCLNYYHTTEGFQREKVALWFPGTDRLEQQSKAVYLQCLKVNQCQFFLNEACINQTEITRKAVKLYVTALFEKEPLY